MMQRRHVLPSSGQCMRVPLPLRGSRRLRHIHRPVPLHPCTPAHCRYVHGFKQRKNAGDDVESGADAERRYGRIYEEGINPFAEFQVRW